MEVSLPDDHERIEELKENAKDHPGIVDIIEVVSFLQHSNPEIRSTAAFILHLEARNEGERVKPVADDLIQSLTDSDWSTRRQSARALSSLANSHPSAVQPGMSDILELFTEFGERERELNYAEKALRSVVNEHPGMAGEYLDQLLEYLDHSSERVREDAAEGIQSLVPLWEDRGMPTSVGEEVAANLEDIVSHLDDDNPYVRKHILQALYRLTRLGTEPEAVARHVSQIAELLDDPHPEPHEFAAETLEQLAAINPEWVDPVKEELLNRLGEETDWDIIRSICRTLGTLGHDEAREKLAYISRNDPNEEVRETASEALENINASSRCDTKLPDSDADPDPSP